MKTITSFCAVLILAFSTMGGCASVKEYATPENAHSATVLLVSGLLAGTAEPDRSKLACNLYAAAVGIRAFAEGGDHVPTAEELKSAILTFLPKAGKYVQLAEIIRGLWQAALPSIGGNVQKGLAWAEAIATGLESSAKPYCGGGPERTPAITPEP